MLRAMRTFSSLGFVCLVSCVPAAKVAEVARADVGTETTKTTSLLESLSSDEAKITGLSPALLQDEAWLVEAGTHHTCVVFVSRTPAKLDLPVSGWDVELDGMPIAADEREPSVHDYAFVTSAPPTAEDARTQNVVVRRAIVCGPPHPDASKVDLVIRFRKDSVEWAEHFGWSVH